MFWALSSWNLKSLLVLRKSHIILIFSLISLGSRPRHSWILHSWIFQEYFLLSLANCKNVYRLQMQDDPNRSLELSPQVTSCYFFTMALTHIYLSKEILVHFFTYLIVHTESIHWTDDTDHLRKPIFTAEWL